jgi:hypothetical protein
LDLKEYTRPIVELSELKTKEEFVDYIQYYQIEKYFLIDQILTRCIYLEYLHEYLKDDILEVLRDGLGIPCSNFSKYRLNYILNDENLKYISKYIEINRLCAENNMHITTVEPFAKTLKELNASGPYCGITNKGLKHANVVERLTICNNHKITTIRPFIKTLKYLNINNHHMGYDKLEKNNLRDLLVEQNENFRKTLKPFGKDTENIERLLIKVEERGEKTYKMFSIEEAIDKKIIFKNYNIRKRYYGTIQQIIFKFGFLKNKNLNIL